MKVYEYINRVDKCFRLAIFKGMKMFSPSRCYAITMILHVRRKILKLLRSPTVASEPGFMRRCYMHEWNTSELWAIQVILLTSMSYFDSAALLDEAARTDLTRTLM